MSTTKVSVTVVSSCIVIALVVFSAATAANAATPAAARIKHRFLVHDEGNAGLAYIDEYDTTKNWKYSNGGQTYWGLQLVGNNRVLLGTSNEVDITTGMQVKPRVTTGGNPSAIRLENGNTLRCYESGSRVIEEVNAAGTSLRKKIFTGMTVLRMATYTPDQTFLFASNHTVDEVDWNGNILWHFGDPDSAIVGANQHICRALRMPNGNTLISTGYGARLLVVSKDKKILNVIGGKNQPGRDSIKPNYYAGFHVLANGHYIVTNWQAHGPGHGGEGVQILEYDSTSLLVWSYKNPSMYSSVQDIIILDDLDITKFHDERTGVIAPVATSGLRNAYRIHDPMEGALITGTVRTGSTALYTIDGKFIGRMPRSVNGIHDLTGMRQHPHAGVLIVKDGRSSPAALLIKR